MDIIIYIHNMRIVHIVSSVSRLSGGLGPVVWDLARHQRLHGIDAVIVSLEDAFTQEDAAPYSEVPLLTAPAVPHSLIAYSRGLSRILGEVGQTADLIHSHGLWLYPGYLARCLSRQRGIPLVLSPHGMLEPWSFHNRWWKKSLGCFFFENANLRHAACLHATAGQEARNLRALGLKKPIAIVPIGLDLKDYGLPDSLQIPPLCYRKDKKHLLFLSRIHPVKGLVNLATAWNRICRDFPDWRLIIAGPDHHNHTPDIQKALTPAALAQTIFPGPVYGSDKIDLLRQADLFVLPTFSENFGIVVLESLACGVPVITTKGAPWAELAERKCGWWVDIGSDPLTDTLREAMAQSHTERQEMGLRGRRLVEEKYAWPEIAKQMLAVYDWILDDDNVTPDCVRVE